MRVSDVMSREFVTSSAVQICRQGKRKRGWKIKATLYINMKWFFVRFCLFVPYTNPHFWSDLNRTSHTSPPSSGGGRRVCFDPQYSTFPTFSVSFLASWCCILRRRWLPAPGSSPRPLYPWFRNACVWRHGRDVCRITTQACQPTQSRACLCC